MRRSAVALCMLGFATLAAAPAEAKSDSIEKIGQAVAIALPVTAGGVSIAKNDWTGLAQMVVVTGAAVGTTFVLKHFIHEERPDHSDMKSFPSDTAALAFAPANFLWDRYGWQYGVPAYLAAGFVGYSRVESKQHHWWDVAASAGIAFGYSRLITTRYVRPYNIDSEIYATPDGAYIDVSYRW